MKKYKYDHIDWKKLVNDGLSIRQAERTTGINYGSCRQYMIRYGFKPNLKQKIQRINNHWNKPCETSSTKYLRNHTLEIPKGRKQTYPQWIKKHLEEN